MREAKALHMLLDTNAHNPIKSSFSFIVIQPNQHQLDVQFRLPLLITKLTGLIPITPKLGIFKVQFKLFFVLHFYWPDLTAKKSIHTLWAIVSYCTLYSSRMITITTMIMFTSQNRNNDVIVNSVSKH